jgi:hypothetical protein
MHTRREFVLNETCSVAYPVKRLASIEMKKTVARTTKTRRQQRLSDMLVIAPCIDQS